MGWQWRTWSASFRRSVRIKEMAQIQMVDYCFNSSSFHSFIFFRDYVIFIMYTLWLLSSTAVRLHEMQFTLFVQCL